MAITLDPALKARLDTVDRQPEIDIVSSEFYDSIPFQGNSFGITGSTTLRPQLITNSAGRLLQIYITGGDMVLMYTDVDRNQWTQVSLASLSSGSVTYATVVELADGNIGVVWLEGDVLKNAAISPTGAVVTSTSTIESMTSAYEWRTPHVVLLSNGAYYLVYIGEDPDVSWNVYARTCTAWGSWGAHSIITPSGLNTAVEINNPSLCEVVEGDLFLLVDYVTVVQDDVTIKNVFSAISLDYGATFGTATARTNYTQFGENGLDPVMVQRCNGDVWIIFYESVRVLHMDSTANNFTTCSGCSAGMGVRWLHCDSANQKIYVAYGNSQAGIKCIGGVAVVDMATWSIDKCYTPTSTPAMSQLFCDTHVTIFAGGGKYLAMAVNYNRQQMCVCVLDHTDDSITHYVLTDISAYAGGLPNPPTDGIVAYGLTSNIEFNSEAGFNFLGIGIQHMEIDGDSDTLYMGWDGDYYRQYMIFSTIDLSAAPDGEGDYSITWLNGPVYGATVPYDNRYWYEWGWDFKVDTDRNYIIVYSAGGAGVTTVSGGVGVFSMDGGISLIKYYSPEDNAGMCKYGLDVGVLYDGCIYGSHVYTGVYPYTDMRGLCKINYVTDAISFWQPTFATANNYPFNDFAVDETNGVIYAATFWGVAKFNTISGAWTLINSDTMSGFVRSGESDVMWFVDYDPVGGNVIMGSPNDYITNFMSGIGMFNENGAFNRLMKISGYKEATWVWEDAATLSQYTNEANPAATIDPDCTLWVTWNHVDWQQGQQVLYWDNDLAGIELQNDLAGTVKIEWKVKRANRLSFNLANGHLYDPQNLFSTKNVVGQKGRKVGVRIGENIDGYIYWADQGTFIVDTANMGYSRGRDPVMSLECVGRTSLWAEQQISVSELYSGMMPDNVINDIISRHTALLSTEYDIPTLSSEHAIYYQWVDKTIWDIIEELCDHFFYAMFEDSKGVFTCRKVDLTQAVDHTYSDQMQLINFSPDDNFSNYTNRVRVIGESKDYTEVIHELEMITTKTGTVGWWVKGYDETIYYDDDQERKCRWPRLVIPESPQFYGILTSQLAAGQGGIYISSIDVYEKYITVHVDIPDLSIAVYSAVSAMVAVGVAAMGCDYGGWFGGAGGRCGYFIMLLAVATGVVFYLLAAVAQYQYEVWANPLGKVKTTIQYVADDLEFQRKLNGEIVTQEITDALCDTVGQCRRVAEGNIGIVKAQRSRLSFSKLAHLQDELLDMLKVYHPYSNEAMEILIVSLQRSYSKGDNGGVVDTIEGWRYRP